MNVTLFEKGCWRLFSRLAEKNDGIWGAEYLGFTSNMLEVASDERSYGSRVVHTKPNVTTALIMCYGINGSDAPSWWHSHSTIYPLCTLRKKDRREIEAVLNNLQIDNELGRILRYVITHARSRRRFNTRGRPWITTRPTVEDKVNKLNGTIGGW